jgi:hypothetical protein
MELTLQQIEELMSFMQKYEIDKLEFGGLVLTKSRHNTAKTSPEIADPAKMLFQAVSNDVPDWIKGREKDMFANPFAYPDSPKEYK